MARRKYILVTGGAGFVGYHLTKALLHRKENVVVLDNLNDFYDPALKRARLRELRKIHAFRFHKVDIANRQALARIFQQYDFFCIYHLAAQVNVRYSFSNPHCYERTNNLGMLNMLGFAGEQKLDRFVYASSSSVYGNAAKGKLSEHLKLDAPLSFYAATKLNNEHVAGIYRRLYRVPAVGVRLFTVYGPWGRPDMAMFLFVRNILAGHAIALNNHGRMQRDFTYVDDIIAGMLAVGEYRGKCPVFNLGSGNPVGVLALLKLIEKALGKKARTRMISKPEDEMLATCADLTLAKKELDYQPTTMLKQGVPSFINWYQRYYR